MRAILLSLVLFGIIIRGAYYVVTPYYSRGQDTDGHIQYIRYVSENLSIPSAKYGWEYHQSPIYYFISGSIMRIEREMEILERKTLFHIQFLSFISSIFLFFCVLFLSFTLYAKNKINQTIFVAIFAVIPALIILTARITNNGLYTAFAYLFAYSFLEWWKSGNRKYWIISNIVLGITLLIRMSGIVFLPILFLSPLLQKNKSKKEKRNLLLLSILILFLLVGWYPIFRFGDNYEIKRSISFGNVSMNHNLMVNNYPKNYFVFNPKNVISTPYNFDWDDNFGRQYFWEYFYKSVYSSGLRFFSVHLIMLTQAMIVFGIILLPLFFWGLAFSIKKNHWLHEPMTLLLFFPLLGNIVYRILFPFAPNQDIRFSLILFLPFVYFFLFGIENTHKIIKYSAYSILTIWISISTVFFILLSFNSYFR